MFKIKSKKEYVISFIIPLFIIIFTFFTYYSGNENFLNIIGTYFDDILLHKRFYSIQTHKNDIIIIKIDTNTLNKLQKSDIGILNFSKKTYADFLENSFEKYGASVVGLDIILSNKSNIGKNDENELKEIFNKYQNKVVITTRGDKKEIPLCKYNNVQHGASEWYTEKVIRKFNIYYPNYNVNENCAGENIYKGNNGGINGFPIEVYKTYLNNLKNKSKSQNKSKLLNYNLQKQIKINKGFFLSKFFHNKEKNKGTFGFKSYSLIDILEGKKTDENGNKIDLKGKIVLLGEVGTLLFDRQTSPVSLNNKMSGVEFHANAIETMKSGNFSYLINDIYVITILSITIFLLYILIIKNKLYISIILLFLLILIHIEIALELFSRGYIYPIFFFIYSIILGFIIIYFYKYITIDKQKIFIKKAFGLFLSPEMVEIISNDPNKLNLKGTKTNLSIFFSDIANFTNLSEKMSPEDLFNFLNEYFSLMTKILTRNKGTLDKYIGDAVMGFFNAPLKIDNHEFLACKTAIQQQKAINILNIKWSRKLNTDLKVRIGINSGIAIAGNLGDKNSRINYTIIGDNVNLASRLEGINKQYGTNIIIGENVYNKVKNDFLIRELDTIKVKGKSKPTKIYELIGFIGKNIIDKKILDSYDKGLQFYYKGDYLNAIIEFEKNIKDNPSKKMISRCKLAKDGKIKIIAGLYQMKEK